MLRVFRVLVILFIGSNLLSVSYGEAKKASDKKRILVVSSYHREYNWSKDSNEGFCAAMLKFKYFDNKEQIEEYTKNDYVETSKVIIKKLWMDAKRKNKKAEIEDISAQIYKIAKDFDPNFIFLGDDEAGNYIGNKFLDTEIPIVFWGFNDSPVKYGIVDSADNPGHNITGVYQSGYYMESLQFLKRIAPKVKTFAVLTDESPSGRAHMKGIEFLVRKDMLPIKWVESIITNDFELWKQKAEELQKIVDAFYVVQYSTLKDEKGNEIPNIEVAKWYVKNIKVPETALGIFVKEGLLCAANDSGYNQGFEAVVIAHDILTKGANPATYPTRTPRRGALMVNKQRAEMLGITLTDEMGIEEYIEEASSLKEIPK